MKEFKEYTDEEALEAMKKDEYIKQVVQVAKMVVPDAKIYTDGSFNIGMYNVFLLNVPEETCIEIAKMIDPDYDIERASEDTEYPLYVDTIFKDHGLIEITNIA